MDWLKRVDAHHRAPLDWTTEVVVVGSGAGGAVVASELAEAGIPTVLVEQGFHHTRKAFNQREPDMMALLYEDAGARTTADGGIVVLQGKAVGGSTVVNWAICFDPPADVLRTWATEHGLPDLLDEDLERALRKVRHVLNVQTIPEEMVPPGGQKLLAGARSLGLVSGMLEHNRTGCLQSGFCMLGCAYDRKQTMLVTYVPRAQHHGAHLLTGARVDRIVHRGDVATGIEGHLCDEQTGEMHPFRIAARHVVVAGGAIGTPMLLQRSGIAPRAGHNLTLHPTSAVIARFDEPIQAHRGIHYTTHVSEWARDGILIESVFAYPGLLAASSMLRGAELERLMSSYDHLAGAIVLVHDEGRGRVEALPDGTPAIHYTVDARDAVRVRKGWQELARIYLAAGAREVLIPHVDARPVTRVADIDSIAQLPMESCRYALFSAHQMGTAPMGPPDRAVCDHRGRVHGMQNVLVADTSLFPTSLGVNPQITAATLATRVAWNLARTISRDDMLQSASVSSPSS